MNTCQECGIDTEKEICANCRKMFEEGVRYALKSLSWDVYGDSITETDLWRDYMGEDTRA